MENSNAIQISDHIDSHNNDISIFSENHVRWSSSQTTSPNFSQMGTTQQGFQEFHNRSSTIQNNQKNQNIREKLRNEAVMRLRESNKKLLYSKINDSVTLGPSDDNYSTKESLINQDNNYHKFNSLEEDISDLKSHENLEEILSDASSASLTSQALKNFNDVIESVNIRIDNLDSKMTKIFDEFQLTSSKIETNNLEINKQLGYLKTAIRNNESMLSNLNTNMINIQKTMDKVLDVIEATSSTNNSSIDQGTIEKLVNFIDSTNCSNTSSLDQASAMRGKYCYVPDTLIQNLFDQTISRFVDFKVSIATENNRSNTSEIKPSNRNSLVAENQNIRKNSLFQSEKKNNVSKSNIVNSNNEKIEQVKVMDDLSSVNKDTALGSKILTRQTFTPRKLEKIYNSNSIGYPYQVINRNEVDWNKHIPKLSDHTWISKTN